MTQTSGTPPGSMSIRRFCKRHGISRSQFYVLLKGGRAPTTFWPGKRRRVSFAAEIEWITRMEADLQPNNDEKRLEAEKTSEPASPAHTNTLV